MEIIIIAAVADNGVIGKDNKLPWHYKEDFKHFKELTSGYAVVMGRKTYDSIGKPLPNRINIVISRNKALKISGCSVVHSLQDAINHCKEDGIKKMFIIGGSSLFAEGLPLADTLELTRIHKAVDGDTYFPQWKKTDWKEVHREDHAEFSFVKYERKH